MGLFGPPNISRLEDAKNFTGLSAALAHRDPTVQSDAMRALIRIGEPAYPYLIEALAHRDPKVQSNVKSALISEGEHYRPIYPYLIKALTDKRVLIVGSAMEILIKIGSPAINPLFREYNSNTDFEKRLTIDNVLSMMEPGCIEYLIQHPDDEHAHRLVANFGESAVEPMINEIKRSKNFDSVHFKNTDDFVQAILKKYSSKAVPLLVSALRELTPGAAKVMEIAERLKKLGWQPENGDAPYWLGLRDSDKLAKMGAPAVHIMIQVLENEANIAEVKDTALNALKNIHDSAAITPLKAYGLNSKSDLVRQISLELLPQLGCDMDDDPEMLIFTGNFQKLPELGERSITPLINALKTERLRARAIEALGLFAIKYHIRESEIVDKLIAITYVPPYIPKSNYLDYIDVFHSYPKDKFRYNAINMLGSIAEKCPDSAPLIAGKLNSFFLSLESDPFIIIRALGRTGEPICIASLCSLLKHEKLEWRKEAAMALVRLYFRGRLNDSEKERILALKNTITQPVIREEGSDGSDFMGYYPWVKITGIGVEFTDPKD